MNHPLLTRHIGPIAERYGVTPAMILGKSRLSENVRPRHALWVALLEEGCAYIEIARMFGVDHTTVMVAVRRWRKREQESRKVRRCSGHVIEGDACTDVEPWSARFFLQAV